MSARVEAAEAARLHRAEAHWLDQCADRLRGAPHRRRAAALLRTGARTPLLPTIATETLR